MNSTELRDLFRSEMADQVQPYLWTDADFFTYANDAQNMFCRRTGGLGDATTVEVTQLDVPLEADWVVTDPSILKIRSAYLVSNGAPIAIINAEDMPRLNLRFDGRTGPVKHLIIGLEADKARVYPVANVADTIQLVVDRMPITSVTDEDQTFEIAPQHHIFLLHWIKYRAYGKQDAETLNVRRAMEFEEKFYAYCDEARRERDKAKHKTRIVAYGGL